MESTINREELMNQFGDLIDAYASDEIYVSDWDMLTAINNVVDAKDDRGPARMVMHRAVQVASAFSFRPGMSNEEANARVKAVLAKLAEVEATIKGARSDSSALEKGDRKVAEIRTMLERLLASDDQESQEAIRILLKSFDSARLREAEEGGAA